MPNRFAQMDCFILAGDPQNPTRDFEPEGDLTRLECGYRRYASIFEKVRLVLHPKQVTERYLNYPHVCDDDPTPSPAVGLVTALRNSTSEAAFIGSTQMRDFPLDMVVDLVNSYNNELFLGYRMAGPNQPVFGICHRKLADQIAAMTDLNCQNLEEMLFASGKLLPLPNKNDVELA